MALLTKSKPGRKKIEDKKESVTVYVRPSDIEKLGGKDTLRDNINAFILFNLNKNGAVLS